MIIRWKIKLKFDNDTFGLKSFMLNKIISFHNINTVVVEYTKNGK